MERKLTTEDLSGYKLHEVYRMARAAWPNDAKRASQFVSKLQHDRLDSVER